MDKPNDTMFKGCYSKTINNHQYVLRHNTMDEYIVKENPYNRSTYSQDDVWLDLGGCIGVFPVKYAGRVQTIHTFEPDEGNLKLLWENLRLNDIKNCVVHNEAVVWDNRKTTDFYINNKKNKGSHSMFIQRGRTKVTVPCVNINTVIRNVRPNKIKMDVEGSEYELIKAIHSWDNIAELVFEYHTAVLRDSEGVRLTELYNILTSKGFKVDGPRTNALGKAWYHLIYCTR